MFKDLNKLTDHYIVCGAGRIGSVVIREIARSGADFVVIEADEALADSLLSLGYLVLMGDATSEAVLRGAGIERARGVVCAVASDPDNLYITLTARDLNRGSFIVARANEESAIRRLRQAGADRVVSPSLTGASQIAQMLLRPAVADFIELATSPEGLALRIEQIVVESDSPFLHRQLKDTHIRAELDCLIFAIQRGDGQMLVNPAAHTAIQARDTLLAIGSHDNLRALRELAAPQCTAAAASPDLHSEQL